MSQVTVADSFFFSAQRLGDKSGKIIDFLVKLIRNPYSPGLHWEPIERATDPRIGSMKINKKFRAVLLKTGDHFTVLNVDGHDEAYRWGAGHKVSEDRVTGQLQVIATREVIEQAKAAAPVSPSAEAPSLFQNHSDEALLAFGVPREWLQSIRSMKDVDQLYATFDHCNDLPGVWEDLIRLANGEPVVPRRQGQSAAPPTSEGRAWVTDDVLEEAWSAPLDDWRRFLHPKQAELVTAEFNGPAKVTGSAGTGKTVIGLHRAAYLAGKGEQVFLTTYTSALRHNLDQQLRRLCPPAVAERVRVATLHSFAQEILKDAGRPSKVVDEEVVMAAIDRHTASHPDARLTADFLRNEWKEVIKAQGIETLDEYLVSKRSGLRTGLVRAARAAAWAVFGPVIAEIGPDLLPSYATACKQASTLLENGSMQSPFGAVIADEVQDFGPQEVKFLASLSSHNPARLLLLGDAGQRIYPGGYVLKDLGIDVVGRSRKLNVGYRTGEQIRRFAERVLGGSRDDLDGQLENAANAFALRKGKAPVLKGFASEAEHDNYLTEQVRSLIADGYEAEEIGVIARGRTPLRRVGDALRRAGIPITPVNDSSGGVNLVTMHSAKGLEYRAVLVANCQAGQVPSYAATKGLGQEDRRVVEERERQLLYVSLTRGREELYVLWVNRLSPFLEPAIRVSE